MSDDEAGFKGGGGGMDDDVALPKATVAKIISELLPPDFACAKDVKDLMTECCREFVMAIASEANEICEKGSKKTILPEHIVEALKALGFDDFITGVESVLADHKELAKDERQKKAKKMGGSGLSQEELLAVQEKMLAESRARFEAGGMAP